MHLVGRRCPPIGLGKGRFHQMEIEYGPSERVIHIPVTFDSNHREAYYENGLLVIRIRCKEANDTIKIDVS